MSDPFGELGLSPEASVADVHGARRRLAKQHHPDVGGDPQRMRAVNAAVAAALAAIAARRDDRGSGSAAGGGAPGGPFPRTPRGPTGPPPATAGADGRRTVHDHASFTIEALPVEAFEALVVVTGWIGEVLVDEPPYLLEVHLREPADCWCRLDLVPDAGSSTVAVTLAAVDATAPVPDIDAVRDLWVAELNRLDWTALGRGGPDERGFTASDRRPPW